MKYVIRWKSRVNGRAGKGTREFPREEADRLVAELNSEYPDIEHEKMEAPDHNSELEPSQTESSSASLSARRFAAKGMHLLSSR